MVDDDDKVRRNLVVTSAALIGVWFLEIPLVKILPGSIDAATWAPAPWKAWLVFLAVLVYQAARYYFSSERRAVLQSIGEAYKAVVDQQVAARLDRELKALPHDLPPDRTTDLGIDYPTLRSRFNTFMVAQAVPVGSVITYKGFGFLGLDGTKGEVELRYEIDGPGYVGDPLNLRMPFKLTFPGLYVVNGRAIWKSWIFSEPAVNLLTPFALATAAGVIAAIELLRALCILPLACPAVAILHNAPVSP